MIGASNREGTVHPDYECLSWSTCIGHQIVARRKSTGGFAQANLPDINAADYWNSSSNFIGTLNRVESYVLLQRYTCLCQLSPRFSARFEPAGKEKISSFLRESPIHHSKS